MYGQIIRFLVIIFIYSVQPVDIKPPVSSTASFILFGAQFFIFYLLCRTVFARRERFFPATTENYDRTESILGLAVIPFYAFLIYGINIKYLLSWLPLVSRSSTLSNLIGLILYFTYLGIIWHTGYPSFSKIFQSRMTAREYLESKLRFYTGMIFPWLALSFLSDIVDYVIPWHFFKTEEGHLFVIISGFVAFSAFGVNLVVKLWQCEPIPRSPKRELIERFLVLHRFPVRDLLFWSPFGDKALTAGIIGFFPKARYILITPALNQILDDDETLAVIAHEMGHVRKLHMPFYLVLFVGYILIVYALSDFVLLWLLSRKSLAALIAQPGVLPATVFSILSTLPFLVFLILYFRYLFGYFSRNCERQADLYALELLKTPVPLISALRKIAFFSGYREDRSNWHHYGIIERIEFIKDAALNPAVGEAHHRRLVAHIKMWFCVVAILVASGLFIKKSSWFEDSTLDANLKIVAAAVNQSIDDALFYAGYGGYLIEKGSYDYAEKILLRGLKRFESDPEILNTLAWLYATAPPPFRKPDKAVELAEKATRISPGSPHIWDTLAEAYYAKGIYDKALAAINRAISLVSSPDDYYLRQKEKIEKRLKE